MSETAPLSCPARHGVYALFEQPAELNAALEKLRKAGFDEHRVGLVTGACDRLCDVMGGPYGACPYAGADCLVQAFTPEVRPEIRGMLLSGVGGLGLGVIALSLPPVRNLFAAGGLLAFVAFLLGCAFVGLELGPPIGAIADEYLRERKRGVMRERIAAGQPYLAMQGTRGELATVRQVLAEVPGVRVAGY